MKERCIQVKDIPQQYFEVGQTVYHPTWGEGTVIKISTDKDYPIEVSFKSNTHHFTANGRFVVSSDVVTLSQNPIPPIINTPIVKFEEGELVFAKTHSKWMLTYFHSKHSDIEGKPLYYTKQSEGAELTIHVEVKKITDIPLPLKM